MKTIIGVWNCECCNFSNPDGLERCSYCDLSRKHTLEELQKYRQAFKNDKNFGRSKGSNMLMVFLSSLGMFVRIAPQTTFLLLVLLLAALPIVKDNMMIFIPLAGIIVFIVFLYFYAKDL